MTRIRIRRGTTIEWNAYNPVLAEGEPGFDTDLKVFKVGDGVTPWVTLPRQAGDAGPAGPPGANGTPGATGAPGAAGVGVPAGGTTGQALVKASGTNFDTTWGDAVGGGDGSAAVATHEARTDNPHTAAGLITQATADGRYVATTSVGVASGVASLSTGGKVLDAQIDSANTETADKIVKYTAAGTTRTNTPTIDKEAANKKYVDDKFTTVPLASVQDLVLTSDVTVNASTTPVILGPMGWTATAGDIWHMAGIIRIDSGTTPDAKIQLKVPAGSAAFGSFVPVGTNITLLGTTQGIIQTNPANQLVHTFATPGTGTIVAVKFEIRVVAAITGTIEMRGSQSTSDASDTLFKTGSWLLASRAA